LLIILFIVSTLQSEQQKRLVIKFDDEDKKLNKNIAKIVHEITQQLSICEKKIKELVKQNIDSETDNIIKINMQHTIIQKITDFTKKFKINQELYKKKYKELVGEDDPTYEINESLRKDNNDSNNFENFLMTDNINQNLQNRDNELNQLLNSVNDLAQIFKDMQSLVMEQGSILDRIDYNIDIAASNITTGKKSLVKANEYHKNNCFRNVIIVLIVCIFIEALLLIFKFI
jgi:syntaxin 16